MLQPGRAMGKGPADRSPRGEKKVGMFLFPRAELQGTPQGWTWMGSAFPSRASPCRGRLPLLHRSHVQMDSKGNRRALRGLVCWGRGKPGMLLDLSWVKSTRTRSLFLPLTQPLNGPGSPNPVLPRCGCAGHTSLVAHPQHPEPGTCPSASPRRSPAPHTIPHSVTAGTQLARLRQIIHYEGEKIAVYFPFHPIIIAFFFLIANYYFQYATEI